MKKKYIVIICTVSFLVFLNVLLFVIRFSVNYPYQTRFDPRYDALDYTTWKSSDKSMRLNVFEFEQLSEHNPMYICSWQNGEITAILDVKANTITFYNKGNECAFGFVKYNKTQMNIDIKSSSCNDITGNIVLFNQ